MNRRSLTVALLSVLCATLAADWRQFRGTDSTGVANDAGVPSTLGKETNVAWKADLPGRGLSSPVIVGDRVFLTASGGQEQDRLFVLAFDAESGRQLWKRSFWGTGPTASHPKTCMAAPTPASDGTYLVALFATDDLVCLDLDGNVRWLRSLYQENPGATDGRGLASSPLIVGSTVVIHLENQNVSFAAAYDVATGAARWRTERPRELNWTSPIAVPGGKPGEKLALLQGSTRLSAVDPMTGKEVWGLDRKSHPIASSVVAGNVLLVPGEKDLTAFELQGGAPPKQLWESARLNPGTSSPLVVKDKVFCLRGPILVSGELKTGNVTGQLRLKGQFSSSPVASGQYVYCFSEDGQSFVVRPDDKDGVLVQPEGNSSAATGFEETVLCTPAIADGALFIRSDKHLWKLAKS
jgi:outer membrane protein assembly factor BamB